MLFGMTNRAGWNGHDPNDNQHLWRLWDEFGIDTAAMFGWWNKSSPVSTGRLGPCLSTDPYQLYFHIEWRDYDPQTTRDHHLMIAK